MDQEEQPEPTKDLFKDYPPLLTVKQVAEIFQVTPLTIKRWGKKGILTPIRINSRGDRRYTKEQILWLIGQRQGDQVKPTIKKNLKSKPEEKKRVEKAPSTQKKTPPKPKKTKKKKEPPQPPKQKTSYSF